MNAISRLPVFEGLCLVRLVDPPPDLCGAGGACYSYKLEIHYHRGSPSGGEQMALYHEYCHAHQHYVARQAGFGDNIHAIFQTDEGKEFLAALEAHKADLARQGLDYVGPGGGRPAEDHAQFCAGWYYGQYPPTATIPFMAEYAAKWWPR